MRLSNTSQPFICTKSESMDDDDDVPPLEATRSRCDTKEKQKEGEGVKVSKRPTEAGKDGGQTSCDIVEEKNEVAEALMQRALAAREQKKKDTEESRRKADGFGGGLKKGFLSSKPKARQTHETAKASASSQNVTEQ